MGIALYFLTYSNNSGTITEDNKDFAIEDTASITKIFLADKNNHTVLLTKGKENIWMVNQKHRARKDLVNVLLKTIKTLEVRSPVGRMAKDNIVKRLSTSAVKVEIYLGKDTPEKVYYVGGATQNTMGTYMLIENSTEPYIMHIPHFFGYLTTRYTTDAVEWRDKLVMNYDFKDLSSVKIEYFTKPESSFLIRERGDWTFELMDIANKKSIEKYDTTALTIYLTQFKNINYEGYTKTVSKEAKDSILLSKPFLSIECTDKIGSTTTITAFLKKLDVPRDGIEGKLITHDLDRLYAEINESGDLITIQYFVFDKLLLELNDFIPKPI